MHSEEYKKTIEGMLKQLDNSDLKFLSQLYTIIKHYLEKRGR